MKKLIIISLMMVVLVGGVSGQSNYVPPKAGDQAILFDFDDFDIDAFRGGFGYKRYINENTAVRGVVSFYSEKEKNTWTQYYGVTDEGYIGDDGFEKYNMFGIEVALEKHMNKGKVDPFFGGGAGFSMRRNKVEMPVYTFEGGSLPEPTTIKNQYPFASNRISLFGLFGLEYAINTMLSLAAEYQLLFAFTSYPDEKWEYGEGEEVTIENGSYRYFGITSGGGLTLLIYFNR